jgi:HEPN domain-containing protein
VADDEQVWEVGWDGHQLAQRQRFARLTLAEKLDWLEEAQRMVKLTGFRDSSIGFRLQQACEKALKSWIHIKGGLAPFTHDLVALMDWLKESGTDVNAFAQIADLSFFAVQTRYDDTVEISSPDWPLLLGITVSLLDQVQGDLT